MESHQGNIDPSGLSLSYITIVSQPTILLAPEACKSSGLPSTALRRHKSQDQGAGFIFQDKSLFSHLLPPPPPPPSGYSLDGLCSCLCGVETRLSSNSQHKPASSRHSGRCYSPQYNATQHPPNGCWCTTPPDDKSHSLSLRNPPRKFLATLSSSVLPRARGELTETDAQSEIERGAACLMTRNPPAWPERLSQEDRDSCFCHLAPPPASPGMRTVKFSSPFLERRN